MKKFLAVILAIMFVFSAFTANAFASESKKAQEWHQNNTIIEDGVKLKTILLFDGEILEGIIYIKNDKFSLQMNSMRIFEGIEAPATFIYKNNSLYMYITSFPFIHLKITDIDNIIDTSVFPEEIESEFIRSYETESYYIEEYTDSEGMFFKYYFVGDSLKIIEVTDPENIDNFTSIEIMETGISDSVFNLPFFSVDLWPLLNYIMGSDIFILT